MCTHEFIWQGGSKSGVVWIGGVHKIMHSLNGGGGGEQSQLVNFENPLTYHSLFNSTDSLSVQ